MPMAKKQLEVIDHGGAKTVAKKTSYITWVKRVFAIISVIWIAFVIWAPLHVKNTYSEPIKKSIVVSMFFDLQRNIVEQYERLLDGIKDAINLEKPVAYAIDKVKMVEGAVDKVTDATAAAKEQTAKATETTAKAKETTSGLKSLTGLAGKLGINTGGVDEALNKVDSGIAQADAGIAKANQAIDKVDNTAQLVNQKLQSIEKDLTNVLQIQIDELIDEAIKHQLDKNTGGLGTTLLTNYQEKCGLKHVYAWRPATWRCASQIYNDLEKSNVGVVKIITNTVNKYFGYVAWGLVIAAWAVGLFIWFKMYGKMKAIIAPFLVCPRCGHTYADKRTAMGLLKVLQPWKWI